MDNLVSFFSGIRLWDVADILLNSYILFRLYAIFRGTQVFRIVMGIVILLFIQRIAVSLGLILTSWVIQGITAAAALIIIVVFRNEIRAVLQVKNLKGFFWGFPSLHTDTPVEVIADAVCDLAQRRMGALLVLLGKEDAGEVIHSGIPWHGQVSKEMILSIFWPDNPVHDGAVIIQRDQIREAAAILPLSQSKDLPSRYGTRHRAAAGLAELTDALIIVVSEERGTISVAKNSDIKGVRGKDDLLRMMREHLGIPEKEEGSRRRGRVELAVAGLLSVIFVSYVWFTMTRGLDTPMTFDIPVEYVNRDPGIQIISASPKTLRVDLIGSSYLARSVREDQINARIDLSNKGIGRELFSITEKNFTLPPGVVLQNVTPQVVEVELDRIVKKVLPIQVDWVGRLPDDLRIVKATLNPRRIPLLGGSRILSEISTIYTEELSLDGIKESGNRTAKLNIEPASLKIDEGAEGTVNINFTVAERTR
jgi:diadenylate cyclase